MRWRAAAGRAPLALLLAAVAAAAAAAAPQDAEIREGVTNILTVAAGVRLGRRRAPPPPLAWEACCGSCGTAVIGGNREGADVGADAAGESDADAGSSEGTGAQNFGHISRQQGATLDAQDQGLENIFESASRDDYDGWLWDGPHQGFTQGRRGHGLILLQHVRKAGGTTLCSMLRQNMNATGADCMLNTRIVGIPSSTARLRRLPRRSRACRMFGSSWPRSGSKRRPRRTVASPLCGAARCERKRSPTVGVLDLHARSHRQDRLSHALRGIWISAGGGPSQAKRHKCARSLSVGARLWFLSPRTPRLWCHLDNYQTRVFARVWRTKHDSS